MGTVIVGKGGTLGALLAARLEAKAIELRAPDPREQSRVEAITNADVVINAGGPRVRKNLDWADYMREHVGVTTRVLQSMRRGTHLVHLSSTAVFGARGELLGADDVAAPTLFPSPAYACAKLAAELVARAVGRERGIHVTILRPSMVYGPGVDSALDSIQRLASRGVALRLAPKDVRQHLTHVDLLVDAVARAAEGNAGHRTLLVADPFVLRNRDIVPARGVPLGLPLDVRRRMRWLAALGFEGPLTALDVLAMDNEFVWAPMFDALGLDPARYARARTFDRYWTGGS